MSLRVWQVTSNIGNIPHLETYCGTKELTCIRYSYRSPAELLPSNKYLGDLTIASCERQPGSCHITNAIRDGLHMTSLRGGRLRYHLRTF